MNLVKKKNWWIISKTCRYLCLIKIIKNENEKINSFFTSVNIFTYNITFNGNRISLPEEKLYFIILYSYKVD